MTTDTLASGRIVVTNRSPSSQNTRLERLVRIGAVDGEASEMFGRITDVALGPNGNLYVLDSQAAEIRVFGAQGDFVRAIGAPGRGPGELASPYSLWIDDEERLWVADEGNRRYSVFDLTGKLVTTYRSPFHGGVGRGQVRVVDNHLWDFDVLASWRPRADGSLERQSVAVGVRTFRVGDVLVPSDTIVFGAWSPPGLTRLAGTERFIALPPFSPRRVQDVGHDGSVWVGTGDAYELHQIGRQGDTLRTVIRTDGRIPLSERDASRASAWLEAAVREGFQRDESVLPTAYPYFSRIVVAEGGQIWVLRDMAGDASSFDRFAPDGRYLGSVSTGLSATVHPHITRDRVLGVAEDALGVQYVELYRIVGF